MAMKRNRQTPTVPGGNLTLYDLLAIFVMVQITKDPQVALAVIQAVLHIH